MRSEDILWLSHRPRDVWGQLSPIRLKYLSLLSAVWPEGAFPAAPLHLPLIIGKFARERGNGRI